MNERQRRLEVAAGQHPLVVLVGCSDSRVSSEILFGRGPGELFIVRVAGNTVDLAGLGSIECVVAGFGVPLVVVLGHERWGAVVAGVEVVEPISPAVLSVRGEAGDIVANAVRANLARAARGLPPSSTLLAGLVEEGKLRILGAQYELGDGFVEFFEA